MVRSLWLLFLCAVCPKKKKLKIKSHSIHLTVRCNAEQSRVEKRITWTTTTNRQATSHWITVKVFGWSNKDAWFVVVLWHCIHNAQHSTVHSEEIARTFNDQFINLCMRKNRKFRLRRKRKSFPFGYESKIGLHHNYNDDRSAVHILFSLFFTSLSFSLSLAFSKPELVHQYTF